MPGLGPLGEYWCVFRALLARDLCYLGRDADADALLREAQAVPPRAAMRVAGLSVEALLLAGRGEAELAEARARLAVEAAETGTDSPWFWGWAHADLRTVLERAGRIDDARGALHRALAVWEQKGCRPCADRTRERIHSLDAAGI